MSRIDGMQKAWILLSMKADPHRSMGRIAGNFMLKV